MNDKDTEIHGEYDDMSVEELEQQLREVFFYTDQIDEMMAEEVEEICAVLDKKKPLEYSYSVEEYWERFLKYYADDHTQIGIQDEPDQLPEPAIRLSEDKKNKREHYHTLLRVGIVAAVVIVLMIGVTLTVAALGYDLWGWIPVWNAEEIYFVRETDEPSVVTSISAALKLQGINDPLTPTWLPDGFVLIESKIEATPMFMNEYYTDADGRYLSILVSSVDDYGAAIYQKNDNPPQEYIVGGAIHYIFENSKSISAVWHAKDYSAVITGSITKEELELMIDSVYGVMK